MVKTSDFLFFPVGRAGAKSRPANVQSTELKTAAGADPSTADQSTVVIVVDQREAVLRVRRVPREARIQALLGPPHGRRGLLGMPHRAATGEVASTVRQ